MGAVRLHAWPSAPTIGGLIGGLDFLGLAGVGAEPNADYAADHPAPGLRRLPDDVRHHHAGADHRRVRGAGALQDVPASSRLLWATLVYDPVAHWVWGVGGILRKLGALDFAGGTVVHITAGFSALAFALVIGARKGFGAAPIEPHNIPYTVLGAGLLWMGWFGFNGGSALAANGLAVNALVTTNTAAAAAGLVWMLLSWRDNKPSVLGIVTGAVVGLVAITPAAGFVTPLAALVIGARGRADQLLRHPLAPETRTWTSRWTCGPVTAWAALWGALATGLFATTAVNPAGADGLFYGNPAQFLIQAGRPSWSASSSPSA